MNRNSSIFIKFLWRDFYIYIKQLKNYLINYLIIYPILFSFTYGYVIPNTLFQTGSLPSVSIILTGVVSVLIFALTVNLNIFLLLDFSQERYIDYQITILNPLLVVVEKILFSTLFSFFLLLPFFPITKLILGNNFDTSHIDITRFIIILFLATLTCSSYVMLSLCVLKGHHQTGSWWRRVNNPLLMLGGSWVPWIIMNKLSTVLGYIVLFNPFLYITEGVRGAILGSANYISFIYCVFALIIFSLLFILFAFYFFKKRTDFVA